MPGLGGGGSGSGFDRLVAKLKLRPCWWVDVAGDRLGKAETGVCVGSGVGEENSLLCFKTSCDGCRFSFANPLEKLVRISEGDLAADEGCGVCVRSRSR